MTLKEKIQQSNDIFFDILKNDSFNSVLDKVSEADEIIFCGVGKNWYICEKVVKTWLSMGIQCQALDCVHALHGDLGMLQSNRKKVIFFISKSGTTQELVRLEKVINELINEHVLNNITTVAFCLNKEVNTDLCDYYLTPSEIEYNNVQEFDNRNLVPSLSINTMQMVLDFMGVTIYESSDILVNNYKYNHMGGNNGKRLGSNSIIEKIN